MQGVHVIIHGKVQGVWFRAWTQDTAKELGITGWVRNLAGGEVETVAQAEQETLDAFLDRLHDGPPLARVKRIDISPCDADERLKSFKVRS
jgi:acylphosphatase